MGTLTSSIVLLSCILAVLGAPSANASSVAGLSNLISEIEISGGQRTPALYPHLRQLGLRFQENGDFESSIQPFRHMQHLVHANSGVYSTLQTESVEHLIRSFIGIGDFEAAETQHQFLFEVARRAYGRDDADMQVARMRLADWYRSTGRYKAAFTLYGEVRDVLENAGGDSLELVQLLRAEALTLFLAGRCCASDKLKRINELVSAGEIFDREDRRRFALEYADMLILERNMLAARNGLASIHANYGPVEHPPTYLGIRNPNGVRAAISNASMVKPDKVITTKKSNGWIIVKSAEVPLPAAIGRPVAICSATIREYIRGDTLAELEGYYLDVALEVDAEGRPHKISLEGNTPSRLNRYLRSVLEESRYRPALTASGNLTEGTLVFRQTFAPKGNGKVRDDLGGWNTLMTSQSCIEADQRGTNKMT